MRLAAGIGPGLLVTQLESLQGDFHAAGPEVFDHLSAPAVK